MSAGAGAGAGAVAGPPPPKWERFGAHSFRVRRETSFLVGSFFFGLQSRLGGWFWWRVGLGGGGSCSLPSIRGCGTLLGWTSNKVNKPLSKSKQAGHFSGATGIVTAVHLYTTRKDSSWVCFYESLDWRLSSTFIN